MWVASAKAVPCLVQIYTDGSVSENGDTGAGFVIAALNITESFYLGKEHFVYTAEVTAILMAFRKNRWPPSYVLQCSSMCRF